MHEEYKTFLNLFFDIARCGLDHAGFVDEEYADEVSGALHLTREDFFINLYEPRAVVEQLIKYLATNTNLLCLIGPRGSGKTTIIRSLQRELEKKRPGSDQLRSFMTMIDLRIETVTNVFNLKDSKAIEQSLRDRLVAAYLGKFFRSARTGENPRFKLWAFLLDPDRAHLLPESIFSVFIPLQDKTAALLRRYDSSHQPQISVEEWLSRRSGEKEVDEITSQVDKLLDFSHLVHAVYHIEKIPQQIVWLDNADILSDKQQTDAMIAIKRLFTPVASLVRMGISIREENVFRDYEISDDGAPPLETRVMVEIPRGPGGYAYFPSKDIPLASDDVLKNIIHKRLQFTWKYQIDNVQRLTTESNLTEFREVNFDKAPQLQKLTPIISKDRFGIILTLTNKLLNAMEDEGAILLANNSLRDFMVIVRDCLADLLRSDKPNKDNALEALQYEKWYISTLFFRRIRHTQRRYKVGVYDVLAATDEWFKHGKQGTGCLLSHLILTATWNLTLGSKEPDSSFARAPQVGDIVARLEVLGYSRKSIIDNLHALYLHNNSRQNLLELRCRSTITTADEISDELQVYLTPRGKCLTSRTSGSFGYLYDCLRLLEGDSQSDEMLIDHPAIRSTNEIINKLLPFLCDIAQMHYVTLKEWHTKDLFKQKRWPREYYIKFGIPAVYPYRKKGPPLLQLQMILLRLANYARSGPETEKLQRLSSKYSEAMESLGNVEPSVADPNFRELLGQPPRA